jgi:DNA-binding LytR/AlgR family response regulator
MKDIQEWQNFLPLNLKNKVMNQPKIIQRIPTENQILFMESDINYTIIHLADGKKLISGYNLKFHEQRTDNEQFMRVNRTFLINKSFIKNVNFNDNFACITMKNDENVVVSRRKLKLLREIHPILFEIE